MSETGPDPRERLRQLREMARQRREAMPDYPDSPEEIAERAELVEAMTPLQFEAMASIDDHEPRERGCGP